MLGSKLLVIFIFVAKSLSANDDDDGTCTDETPWNCEFAGTLDSGDFFSHGTGEGSQVFQHPDQEVPDHFDAREAWPKCKSIRTIVNQGQCSICWAVETALTTSDRWCIASNQTSQYQFSILDLANCCLKCQPSKKKNKSACKGGASPAWALDYLTTEGVVSEECKPFPTDMKKVPQSLESCDKFCPASPDNKIPYKRQKTDKVGYLRMLTFTNYEEVAKNVKQIQIEIMKRGPVLAGSYVTEEFKNYTYSKAKILVTDHPYNHTVDKGSGHAIRIIGWGEEDGIPYWLIGNSWSTKWREGGFGKIRRGYYDVGIESDFNGAIIDDAVLKYIHDNNDDNNDDKNNTTDKNIVESTTDSSTIIVENHAPNCRSQIWSIVVSVGITMCFYLNF